MRKSSITGLDSNCSPSRRPVPRAAASFAASTSTTIDLPTRTSGTFVQPRAGSASRSRLPAGSARPGLQGHQHLERVTLLPCARSAHPCQVARERLAGQPLVGLTVRAAVRSTTSAGRLGAGGSRSHPLASSQSRTNCLSNDGWPRPGAYPSAGQKRERVGVSTSSTRISSPSGGTRTRTSCPPG